MTPPTLNSTKHGRAARMRCKQVCKVFFIDKDDLQNRIFMYFLYYADRISTSSCILFSSLTQLYEFFIITQLLVN